jgi:hypothetical protein
MHGVYLRSGMPTTQKYGPRLATRRATSAAGWPLQEPSETRRSPGPQAAEKASRPAPTDGDPEAALAVTATRSMLVSRFAWVEDPA